MKIASPSGQDISRVLLVAIAVLCVIATILKLAPLFQGYDTVQVSLKFSKAADSPGAKLDTILLDNLGHLSYVRSFDHVFAGGVRKATFNQPFWLDRCEVRQGDFYKFTQWQLFHPEITIAAANQPHSWQYASSSKDHKISGRVDAPANGISWFDAYAYCYAVGGRLPNVAEWIAAASGKGRRLYPWGDTFRHEAWPYLDPLLNAAQKCGLHDTSNTPEGIADMANNVSEWAVLQNAYRGGYVVMGGNAFSTPKELHSLSMLYRLAPANFRSPYIGFRCAYDNPPVATPWRTVLATTPVAAGTYGIGIPKDSRLPNLIASLPKDRLELIRRIFLAGDRHSGTGDLYVLSTEVTREQYDAFLHDIFVRLGLYAEENEPRSHDYKPPDWDQQKKQPQLPIVNIDWWSAYAFAAWAGGQLPTAEEWASIASGQGQRLYPWGNTFSSTQAVTAEQNRTGPKAVTDIGNDVTPEGILGLGGNVSEWTRSISSVSGAYAIVVKGGNYLVPGNTAARMDANNHVSPHYRSPTLGFRVVFETSR